MTRQYLKTENKGSFFRGPYFSQTFVFFPYFVFGIDTNHAHRVKTYHGLSVTEVDPVQRTKSHRVTYLPPQETWGIPNMEMSAAKIHNYELKLVKKSKISSSVNYQYICT